MADRDAWEQSLYRFAAVLLRDADLARRVTGETLEAAILKSPPCADADRLAMLLFQDVRRRALKILPAPATPTSKGAGILPDAAVDTISAGVDSGRIEEALHALPEPGRSALTLLLLDAMESESIAKLLGLEQAAFAISVQAARLAMHHALQPAPTEAAS